MTRRTILSLVAALLPLGASLPSAAQCTNSLATLNGQYLASGSGDAFTVVGLIDQPDSVAAYIKFNGDGTLSKTKFSEFRNGNETEYQLTSGSYTLNSDPDAAGKCSYSLSFSLKNAANGNTASRAYRLIIGDNLNLTPPERLVFDNTSSGADTALNAFATTNPAACAQSVVTGTHPFIVLGDNANNVKTQGIREITVDASGKVTGTGHVSYNGVQDLETISGTATVNTDCTVTMNVTVVPNKSGSTTIKESTYLRFNASGLVRWVWPDRTL